MLIAGKLYVCVCVCMVGAESIWGPVMQHFYEPKTALKNKGFLFCFVLKKKGERKNEEGSFDA